MSSEMEKFVLQYSVQMEDAIARLEQLDGAVTKVQKNQKAAKGELAALGKGSVEELSKVVPQLNQVSMAVRALGSEFAVAAVAVGILSVGIKSALDLREQYGQQRADSLQVGISPLRMEEYQRKFVKNSNGYVTREMVPDQLKKLSALTTGAYMDPTRMGTENRQSRILGLSVPARGTAPNTLNNALKELATTFRGMSDAQVKGKADSVGMNRDFALAVKKIGPQNIGKMTEVTDAEANERQEAQKAVDEYNKSLNDLNQKFLELSNALGQVFIPKLTNFIEWLLEVTKRIPQVASVAKKAVAAVPTPYSIYDNMTSGRRLHWWEAGAVPQTLFGIGKRIATGKPNEYKNDSTYLAEEKLPDKDIPVGLSLLAWKDPANVIAEAAKTTKQTAATQAETEDKVSEAQKAQSANMSLAVSMFSGAVATFANAVDERQAWAAWAGEVGRAAGLGQGFGDDLNGMQDSSTGKVQTPRTPNFAAQQDSKAYGTPPDTKYDDIIKKYAAKDGVSEDLIKRVINVESRGINSATGTPVQVRPGVYERAEGLMQIMPANKKNLKITDSYDPDQNIRGGTALLKEALEKTGGNVREALMMYHGGPNRANWGKYTLSYPDKVLGTDKKTGKGTDQNEIGLAQVQNTVAQGLGLPDPNQLRGGEINKGDVDWKLHQLGAGIRNNTFNSQKDLMNPYAPLSEKAKTIQNINEQQSGLNMLNRFGDQVNDKQQAGDRSITIGENAIQININGVGDASATGTAVERILDQKLSDIAHHAADGMKY